MLNRRQLFTSRTRERAVAESDFWLHVHREAMACRFEVTLPGSDRRGLQIAQQALNGIDLLEDQLSVFRSSSEVSRINREAANHAIEVESGLFTLFLLCRHLHRETDGAFDITTGPLTRCWGFLDRAGRVPSDADLEAARNCVGMHLLQLDRATQTIKFALPGVEINLGSIGKGYALDRVAERMRALGVPRALISGGSSSVLAIGRGTDQGWIVGLRHPRSRDRRMAQLKLKDAAMATSGSAEQHFENEGRRYGHIIDPRSGRPSGGVLTVTAVAQHAAVADGLATAFFVGGRELAERYCAAHPEVLVVMVEKNEPEHPIILGSNNHCGVEIID